MRKLPRPQATEMPSEGAQNTIPGAAHAGGWGAKAASQIRNWSPYKRVSATGAGLKARILRSTCSASSCQSISASVLVIFGA